MSAWTAEEDALILVYISKSKHRRCDFAQLMTNVNAAGGGDKTRVDIHNRVYSLKHNLSLPSMSEVDKDAIRENGINLDCISPKVMKECAHELFLSCYWTDEELRRIEEIKAKKRSKWIGNPDVL